MGISASLSLESLNADYHREDSFTQVRAACLLVFLGVATFAQYEIFFFPAYLRKLEKEEDTKQVGLIKTLFILYHLPWAISSIYIATRPEAMWNSWLYVVTMVGFTVWPMVSQNPCTC